MKEGAACKRSRHREEVTKSKGLKRSKRQQRRKKVTLKRRRGQIARVQKK